MPERIGHRGVLEAAVHVAERAFGFFVDRTCRAGGSIVGLHAERAASCGSDRAVHDAAAGFLGLHDAAA